MVTPTGCRAAATQTPAGPAASEARSPAPRTPTKSKAPAAEFVPAPLVEPSEWFEAELVLALSEFRFYPHSEDENHPRFMLFADGHVLYRRLEGERWIWFVTQIDPDEARRLQRQVADDLAGTPARFSCQAATHQTHTELLVLDAGQWRNYEGYALDACNAAFDAAHPPASSSSGQQRPADEIPEGFLRSYQAIVALHPESAEPFHPPQIEMYVGRDDGQYSYEPLQWPGAIPRPERMPSSTKNYMLDGKYDELVRANAPLGVHWAYEGVTYIVMPTRVLPGEEAFAQARSIAKDSVAASYEDGCRTAMAGLRQCLDQHAELNTRADALCRELTVLAEEAEYCSWETDGIDVCAHAFEGGCALTQ